jgi:hypothetical protein
MGEAPGLLSPNVAILPYLEQAPLAGGLNINIAVPFLSNDPSSWTVGRTRVATFLCPSDVNNDKRSEDGYGYRPSSYAWNSGTWIALSRSWDGLFGRSSAIPGKAAPLGPIGIGAVVDGLSNTLLVAESVLGPGAVGAPVTPYSDCYAMAVKDPSLSRLTDARDAERLVTYCQTQMDFRETRYIPHHGRWRYKGFSWLDGNLGRDWFNTAQPPNRLCCALKGTGMSYVLKPASAYHPGIVHAALADGSARAYKETVSGPTWRALGTRAGGEIVSAGLD